MFAHKLPNSFAHAPLREDQISYGNLVMRINISGKRSKRAVRHANRHGWHMLE
jgi:hypothetical protein